jgi:hypothetical protein
MNNACRQKGKPQFSKAKTCLKIVFMRLPAVKLNQENPEWQGGES